MSSVVERHDLDDGRIVVSRHITDAEWRRREPHLIDAEASALRFAERSPLSAPTLVATDAPSGRLLMTFVEGEMRTTAAELRVRTSAMAQLAIDISAVELPSVHGLPPWRSWASAQLAPPRWGDRALWSEAIATFLSRSEPQAEQPVLLHRDLHPLNILWDRHDRPTVVDWVNACVGHPHAELGHCRWNLTVLAGLDCADAFLDTYLTTTGDRAYDRFWDLAPVMSFLPDGPGVSGWHAVGRTDLTITAVIDQTETFLRSALVDRTPAVDRTTPTQPPSP